MKKKVKLLPQVGGAGLPAEKAPGEKWGVLLGWVEFQEVRVREEVEVGRPPGCP